MTLGIFLTVRHVARLLAPVMALVPIGTALSSGHTALMSHVSPKGEVGETMGSAQSLPGSTGWWRR